jgi:predicted N-acyltransferase
LAAGVARYLADERRAVAESNRMLADYAPYKKALADEQD